MSRAPLAGRHKKFLRGQAHGLRPLVHIGRAGVTDAVVESLDEAIGHHELIKVRFLEHKDEKRDLARDLADRLEAELAGMVGHVAILYRPAREPDRRRIQLPD